MADQKFQPQSTSQTDTDLFVKGMTKDPNASLTGQQNWTHARNLINNSKDGDVGVVGNEPANLLCVNIPYTIIGTIYLYGDKWVIFSTDNTSSEIGMFDDSQCTYEVIVNDACLNFNKLHLVTGASKENFDCSWQIYWDDGNNPSRTLNLDRIPWQLEETSAEGADCVIYTPIEPKRLNCEWIRLAPLVDVPCVVVNKNKDGGQLRNGAYQAFIAYVVNEQKVGDFIGISNIQTLFDHEDTAGSLDIKVTNLDKEFKFYMLVLVSNNAGQMQAKQIGIYSTEQESITIDFIDQKLASVPLGTIPLRNPAYEKSDKMYIVNDYLIRQGPYENFDFNYQPLANKIETNWVSTEYPADYYYNGGNKPTFMRDEQYAFFIRFVYNTGERSQSYHIPGRGPDTTTEAGTGLFGDGANDTEDRDLVGGTNVLGGPEPFWRVYNTATQNDALPGVSVGDTTDDGGVVAAKGKMGFWQSTERYPATDPLRWDDLCGKPIRHHKMPNEFTCAETDRSTTDAQSIYILGVEFTNIAWPVDNQNPPQPIPNLVGYEVLVGAREGNKSIIAKGLLRNMRGYDLEDDNEGATEGLIANFPFNDLRSDPYHVKDCEDTTGTYGSNYSKDDFYTFHSPETSFNRIYLNPFEVRSYGVNSGFAFGRFYKSEKHPGAKLLRDAAAIIAAFIGAGYAIQQMRGERIEKVKKAKTVSKAKDPGPIYDVKNTRNDKHSNPNIKQNPSRYTGGTTSGSFGGWIFSPLYTNYTGLSISNPDLRQDDTEYDGTQDNDAAWEFSSGDFETPHNLEKGQTESPNNEYYEASAEAAIDAQDADDTTGPPPSTPATITAGSESVTYPSQVSNLADSGAAGDHQIRESVATFGSVVSPGMFEETYMNHSRKAQEQISKKTPGSEAPEKSVEHRGTRAKALPNAIEWMQGLMTFLTLMADGGQVIIDLIYNMSSYNDHAIKYGGHGLYYRTHGTSGGKYSATQSFRARVDKARYVQDSFQNIDANNKINNLFRPATVAVKTESGLTLPNSWPGAPTDNSRFTVGDPTGTVAIAYDQQNPQRGYLSNIAAHYAGLKLNFDNQYGQLDGIRQIPIRGCIDYFDPEYDSNVNIINPNTEERYSTQLLFGGDCYINRYTEKNIKPFFWDFLYDQPDGFPFNYKLRQNSPCPRYWMNTQKYDMSGMVAPIMDLTFDFSGGMSGTGALPSSYYNLDRGDPILADGVGGEDADGARPAGGNTIGSLFVHKKGYIYTHSCGIQDFFVESELNMAHRDWEDRDGERHYDWLEMTDIKGLFDAKIIKDGNFYKYDPSLSKNKLFSQLISFGTIQPRDYDPFVSEYCYVHYPKRLIYSMQAQKEAKMDFWRVFLPNNYKDFKNQVNVIKPISKNGAIIFFPHLSPQMFQGVDQLTTDLNTKITIGDGGLFTSIPQTNVTNADLPHEYGSCESARSVINTPSGLFYISQAQGKVFQYGGSGITNIANNGMKQWFNKYLPSRLLASFPEIEKLDEIIDNPVVGAGCQSVYDPNYDIVYFCKRDFEPIHRECMRYEEGVGFIYDEALCSSEGLIDLGNQYECEEGFDLVYSEDPEVLQAVGDFTSDGAWVCQCNEITYVANEFIPGEDTYQGGWVTPEADPCEIDIIVSVDASQSITQNSNQDNMRDLLLGFIGHKVEDGVVVIDEDNPGFRPGIENGEIRIGFVGWSYKQIGLTTFAGDPYPDIDGPSPMQMLSSVNAALNWIDDYYENLSTTTGLTNHAAGLWDGLDMLYNPGWDIDGNTFQPDYNSDVQPSYEHARLGVEKLLIFITDGLGNIGNSPSSSSPLADDGVTVNLPLPPPYQHTLRPNLTFPGTTDAQNRGLNNTVDDACKNDGNMGGCDSDSYIRGWQINGFMDQNEISDADDAMGLDDIDAQYARTETVRFKGLDGGYVGRGRCKDHLDQYYAVDTDVGIVIPTSPFDYSVTEYGVEGKIYTTPVMGSNWAPYAECDGEPYGISTVADNDDISVLGSELATWWNNFVIGDINGDNPIAADNRKVIYKEEEVMEKWGELTVFPIYLKAASDGSVTSQEVSYFEQYASHPKSENTATGTFNSDTVRTIVDEITQRLCPPPERYWDDERFFTPGVDEVIDGICPPNTTWIEDVAPTGTTGYGGVNCLCNDIVAATNIGEGFQVDLDDPEYFRDVSWTVSYDPKIQGWLSFHDWHPELTMPSLKHFLTTKTGESPEPNCPEGYTFSTTGENAGLCCSDGTYTELGNTTLEYGTYDFIPGNQGGMTMGPNGEEPTSLSIINGDFELQDGDYDWGPYATMGYTPSPWIQCKRPEHNPTALGYPFASIYDQSSIYGGCKGSEPDGYDVPTPPFGQQTPDTLPFVNCGTAFYTLFGGQYDDGLFDEYGTNSLGEGIGGMLPANSGSTYIGMTYSKSNGIVEPYPAMTSGITEWQEGVSQQMSGPMVPGVRYNMTLALAVPPPGAGVWEAYPEESGIRIWGGMDQCACYDNQDDPNYQSEVLWESGMLDIDSHWQNWTIYNIELNPTKAFTHIHFQIISDGISSMSPAAATTFGGDKGTYIYMDSVSTIEPEVIPSTPDRCYCEDGFTMVDSVGQPTSDCRPSNQCVRTICNCKVVEGNTASYTTGNCDTYEEYLGLEVNPFPYTCHYDFVNCIEASNDLGGIWKHNIRCDLFANYYTKQYPWEIELVSSMGQTIEMLRSVEYQLEVFDYITNYAKDATGNDILDQPLNLNCEDRYQELTYNFNEAIIYNQEQISGLLKLNMQPTDPPLITSYPIIGGADIQILYDKVEQQFRFNQFWDITNDRNVPETQFITQMNGYIRDLNQANMDYSKAELQRKKFRNYYNKVLLRRMPIEAGLDVNGNMTYEPENKKMLLKLVNTKLNHSFR